MNERTHHLSTAAFWELLGIELLEADKGNSLIKVTIEAKHLQIYGRVHGGVLMTLIDNAVGSALHSLLDEGQASATTDLHSQFLRSLSAGTLYAKGNIVKKGRNMAFGRSEVFDDNEKLIAMGSASFAILDRSSWQR